MVLVTAQKMQIPQMAYVTITFVLPLLPTSTATLLQKTFLFPNEDLIHFQESMPPLILLFWFENLLVLP